MVRFGQATDDNLIRRMHISCYITNHINTHSGYVILFHCKQRLRESVSISRFDTLPELLTCGVSSFPCCISY